MTLGLLLNDLQFLQNGCIILAMQEILARAVDPKAPLRVQEFYELRIDDTIAFDEHSFVVCKIRAFWDDQPGKIVWDKGEYEPFRKIEDADRRVQELRDALAKDGFIYSDLDY